MAGLRLGGIADSARLGAARKYAENLGLAFQIRDDVLDVCGDAAALGKSVGRDEGNGKVTFAALLGADGCEEAAERVMQALMTALPEGLRLEALKWDETAWDKTSGMFRLCARAEYRAYFVAETAEEETVFTDFVLKGTVKEHE